jgi:hypothetical protein
MLVAFIGGVTVSVGFYYALHNRFIRDTKLVSGDLKAASQQINRIAPPEVRFSEAEFERPPLQKLVKYSVRFPSTLSKHAPWS